MGLNLILYLKDAGGLHADEDFDSARLQGDREFDSWATQHAVFDGEEWRPADLEVAMSWVRRSVVPENQDRLLDALARMEADPRLWFYSSY